MDPVLLSLKLNKPEYDTSRRPVLVAPHSGSMTNNSNLTSLLLAPVYPNLPTHCLTKTSSGLLSELDTHTNSRDGTEKGEIFSLPRHWRTSSRGILELHMSSRSSRSILWLSSASFDGQPVVEVGWCCSSCLRQGIFNMNVGWKGHSDTDLCMRVTVSFL